MMVTWRRAGHNQPADSEKYEEETQIRSGV